MIPLIITRLCSKMSMAIPEVTKISSNVIRVLGCNPGPMTLQGTNTYVVGTGKRRILIDTGEADIPQYIKQLGQVLDTENISLAHICLTHWHHDHVGGLKNILDDLPRFIDKCQIWKYPHSDNSKLPSQKTNHLTNGQEISVEGATLRVIHTPGHTTDHIILHLLEDNIVFSGDCILGEGTAVFEDLHDYMNSLKIILDLQPAFIYPAHGNIINDPIDKIQYYLHHRQQRELQIMEVLNKNPTQLFSENDLVREIYTGLSDTLIKAAESNVNHHLQKLLKEGNVVKTNELWQYKQ